jgi:hypothetical protein
MTPPDETTSQRQDRLLAAEDGRQCAVFKAGTGLGSLATTERIDSVIVNFSLPSGPALFLNLAYKAFEPYRDVEVPKLFDLHPQGRWPDDVKALFDFCEQYAAHVIFAFTALEAFANEVIANQVVENKYSYTTRRATQRGKPAQKVTYRGEEIERNVSLNEKLAQVLPDALSVDSPKGRHIWRDYTNLKRLRDRIIHLKMADRAPRGPEVESIWGGMLRNPKEPFCDNTHKIMGHYGPTVINRRWHQKYPYS